MIEDSVLESHRRLVYLPVDVIDPKLLSSSPTSGEGWRQLETRSTRLIVRDMFSSTHDTDIDFISDMFFHSNASLYIFLKGHPSPQCVRSASCSSSHKLITQILYFLEYLDIVNFLHFFVPWLSRTDNFTITAKRSWKFDTNDYFHWQNY